MKWLNRKEYPFESNYIQIHGQNMHFIRQGKGETILFVHGTPSWSFDFRKIIKVLDRDYDCVAADHIGFGLSSKPKYYNYSTIQHSLSLEEFVQKTELQDITLVVHDFGGPIGLSFAIKNPDLIKRLVILNSWLWSSEEDLDFKKFKKVLKNPILPFLYRYLNFSARFLLPASFGDKKMSKDILLNYTRVFRNKNEREGTLAFAQSLLKDQLWFEELWRNKHNIKNKPTLFIWGMKDNYIKPHYLDKFRKGFINNSVYKLDGCGHFPQEEESEKVSNYILDFMRNS